jgi:lipoprotein-anchoring transpeptidase ErfK/SrfK
MLNTYQSVNGSSGRTGRLTGMIALVTLVTLLAVTFLPRAARAQDANLVYFDGTGQTLGGAFYDGWLAQGGLDDAGAPISPAIQQGDGWVQWFEHTRLEVSEPTLDAADAEDVHPASIGMALAESFGLSRWHPAFQPVSGAAGEGARAFPTNHTLANAFLDAWETNDGEVRLGAPISEEFGLGDKTYQFFERGALSWDEANGVQMVPLGYVDAAMNGNLQMGAARPEGVPIYGTVNGYGTGGKWIDINLSNYTLTAYEGGTAVYSTVIVDGEPASPTVTGSFYTYWKLETQTMEGVRASGLEYIQEDVPWVMYFYADYAIHGAYWRSSFGYSASNGCVNVPVGDAAWLYSWAPVGTLVEVHY